jgi:hypothetical protein
MIKNPGKENFFLNGRKIVLGWPTSDAGLLNFLLGIDPSTYRRKLMAEIYLAIPVVYRDLPLLLYYLSHFTVSQLKKLYRNSSETRIYSKDVTVLLLF